MGICNHAHSEIRFEAKKCPLCQIVQENRKLNQLIENLKFDLLINETEAFLWVDRQGAFVARA